MQNRNNISLFSYKYLHLSFHIILLTKFKFHGAKTMHNAIKTKTNIVVLNNIFSQRTDDLINIVIPSNNLHTID